MEEAGDEPLFCERAAGIDIGKQLVSVTIRIPSDTRRGGRQQETREFGTTRRQLLELADWLRCWGVTRAGMEATSDYWKPVYFLLEREGLDLLLYQASQVKALPGRPKTDKLDSVLAGQGHRARVAGRLVRAAGGHPAAAHPYPLPAEADPGPHRGEAAGRETAGGCAPQAVGRDQRHPRRLRPRHAGSGHRRRAEPQDPGGPGPGCHAPQARPAGRGHGLLVLYPRARLRPADDAGQHRPSHRADRRAGRADSRLVRALRTADRAAGRHPGLRGGQRAGPDRRDRHRHDGVPDRRAPVLLGQGRPPRPAVRRQAQGQRRLRPRQPLYRGHPRRGLRQRRPDPDLPRR